MNLEILTFLLYLTIAGNTTILLGQALFKNGAVFLTRIFQSTPHLVDPINKLLLVGFYLINLGLVLAFFTQKTTVISDYAQSLEFLSNKLGIVYLLLGGMHIFNLLVFITIEKRINSASFLQIKDSA